MGQWCGTCPGPFARPQPEAQIFGGQSSALQFLRLEALIYPSPKKSQARTTKLTYPNM
jgi:hypothetical protein